MRKRKADYEEIFLHCDAKNHPVITLLHLLKDNVGRALLCIVFFILKNSPSWVVPILTSAIINEATNPGENTVRNIIVYMIVGSVFLVQNVPTHQAEIYFSSRIVRDIGMRLRFALVRKLQHLSISFHKNYSAGRIHSKILRDVDSIEQLARSFIGTIVQSILNILIYASITVSRSPMVAIFFLLTIPVAAILIRSFRTTIHHTVSEYRKEVEHLSAGVAEMVQMIPVTKAHGLERVETNKISTHLEEVKKKAVRTDTVQNLFGASSWASFQLFQLLCLCFTGFLAYKGRISVGEIAMFQSYFSSLLGTVSGLIALYPIITSGIEAMSSVAEILASDDIENNKGKMRLSEVRGQYTFDHVGFMYPDDKATHVLEDFCLEVKEGECIAFVGESGSGKTTLLNLLIGFHFPTEGTLTIDGHDIKDINLTAYRRNIAVVSQNNVLFSGSIRDNITYGLSHVTNKEIKAVIEMANLQSVIDELPDGIHTKIGEQGSRLSGGQKQRIAIARAMIRDPKIILLDEATSALDNVSERKVQEAMDKLIHGRTTFVVAHRLSTIRGADRIVVMKQGRCVEIGTYDELIAKKGYFYTLDKMH